MNDDRQAGRKEIGGGGEWTALRELIEWLREQSDELMKNAIGRESTAAMMRASTPQELREAKKTAEMMMGRKLPKVSTSVEETKMEADMQCSIAAKLDKRARQLSAWADQLEALAAEAPAPAAALNESDVLNALVDMTDGVMWKQPEEDGHVTRFTALLNKKFVAPPPQDGQGAELSGPPRGGQLSDLADQLSQVRAALAWLLENQPGTVWCNGPDESNGVNCTACNARTWKEGETLVHMPECQFANALALAGMPTVTRNEAVAGNASAPVGEPNLFTPEIVEMLNKREAEMDAGKFDELAGQPSGVGEPQIYETADAIWKRMYKFSTGQDFPAGEMVSPAGQGIIAQEIRKLLAQSAAREVGEGLREAAEKHLSVKYGTDSMPADPWRVEYLLPRGAIISVNARMNGHQIRAQIRGMLVEFGQELAALAAPAPKPAPPAQPSCKCSTLDGQGICNACADMLRQQVQRQREINGELVKPAPPAEPLRLALERCREQAWDYDEHARSMANGAQLSHSIKTEVDSALGEHVQFVPSREAWMREVRRAAERKPPR